MDKDPASERSSSGKVSIRAAELADAGALGSLMGELGYETRTSEMQMRLETILKDSRFKTFLAVRGGKICGMIGTLCHYSYEHNDVSGRIIALVVAKDGRRRRIGHQLIAAAEADFSRRNIRRVALNTRFERKEAHEFYERLGYERNGFRFVKELPPAAD